MGLHGRTKRVALAGSTSPTFAYSRQAELLATFTSERPAPITLLVSCETASLPNNPNNPMSFFLPCNLGGEEPAGKTIGRTGVLVLEYGAGAARNYVFADLKPGAYALPVCDYAQASVLVFDPHASAPNPLPTVNVGMTFLEGQHRNPARFTSTWILTMPAASNAGGLIPAQARWVDIEGGHVESAAFVVTAGAVRFLEENTLVTSYGSGRYIVRDAAAGLYVPDQLPAELAGANGFRVWNDAAAARTITLKFFLDL